MTSDRGYPLPAGDAFTDELCPVVVCVPNKDEYFRALWSSLDYLGTWVAWERDDQKRGKDAAASWKYANEQTEVGNRMGCMDELITAINDLQSLLATKKDCCDQTVTYGPGDTVETDITPGVGNPPTFYGETAISSWEEWEDHVCYNAHLWVDMLVEKCDQLQIAVAVAGISLGLIAAVLSFASGVGLVLAISYGIAAEIVPLIATLATLTTFSDAKVLIEADRNDIICALLQGGDVSAAVETALASGLAWDIFFQFVDYSTATAIIYEGGNGTEYLPAETRTDCDCEVPYPPGYVVQPASLIACISGSPYCNGVSVSGNVVTLTGYTQTAGFRCSITSPGAVVGYLVLASLSGGNFIAADDTCGNKSMAVGNVPYKLNGWTAGFISQTHKDAWQAWIDNHQATSYPQNACTPPDDFQSKNNSGGSINGTFTLYHIKLA